MKFPILTKEQIEVRIAQVKKNGLSLLLYMDARAAAQLLDDAVGCLNWKCSYMCIDGKMFCRVEIWDESKKEWIAKENVGTESYSEAEKGQASDALKRAVATWGVRELYTSPFIWIKSTDCNISSENKLACYDKFSVSDIEIEEQSRRITRLEITNDTMGKVCFSWKSGTKPFIPKTKAEEKKPTAFGDVQFEQPPARYRLIAKLKEKGIDAKQYATEHGLTKETSEEMYEILLKSLE
jgi:hypothetical protein